MQEEIVHYTDIWMDTRKATEGSLFICSQGASFNSHSAVPDIVDRGVRAIVITQDIPDESYDYAEEAGVEIIERIGEDMQLVIDDYLERVYPMQPCIIAVTGTDGKSSTVHYCRLLARTVGIVSASIGTLGLVSDMGVPERYGSDAGMTTPDRVTLRQWLHALAESGVSHVFIEYSSIGIHQGRLRGSVVWGALWTTQGTDHLDYHGTVEAYLSEKKKLFTEIVSPQGFSLIHDSVTALLDVDCRSNTVSRSETLRSFYKKNMGYVVEYRGVAVQTRLHAAYHIYNLSLALDCMSLLGYEYDFTETLQTITPPCGRFDSLGGEGNHPLVIIDYAHTADALLSVLQECRSILGEAGRLWCVFGCGGDRDSTKRPVMGAAADAAAHHIIITDDNPRTEDRDSIHQQILAGVSDRENAQIIPDRTKAIQYVLSHAVIGDVVLIAGKGHETYQIVGTVKHHFSDHEVVRQVFDGVGSEAHL
jgi:UDP-N-acetylmuramoyl-L-alanyl-D-glutamate--2,6-diaminopimelate ligase